MKDFKRLLIKFIIIIIVIGIGIIVTLFITENILKVK